MRNLLRDLRSTWQALIHPQPWPEPDEDEVSRAARLSVDSRREAPRRLCGRLSVRHAGGGVTSDDQVLGLVADGKDPAAGEPDLKQWLGHREGCSSQWSRWCDCNPTNTVDLDEIVCERHGRHPCWSCMKQQEVLR